MQRSFALLVGGVCMFGAAGPARAAEESLDVGVRYSILDEDGDASRTLEGEALARFVNRARCECGTPIQAEFQATGGVGEVARTILGFVGSRCADREAAEGRNGLCALLAEEPAAALRDGFAALFHPAFLGSHVDSAGRDVGSPYTALARGCEGEGDGGAWLCDPEANGVAGCQEDDFVVAPESARGLLHYDFEPPYELPYDLRAESRAGGVLLSWSSPDSPDIAGFRVLCETDWQYSAELDVPAPARDGVPDGTTYYTAGSVCGGEPLTVVKVEDDGTPRFCGDGRVDAGEECDDGDQNSDEGLCGADCQLCVSREMQQLDWSRVCSGFIPPDQTSVFIEGLGPGSDYVFALVAHDAAGNARALGQLATIAWDEDETDDFDDADGFLGLCSVSPEGQGAWGMSLWTCFALAWARRRRRA
ncbi:hypothetical protein [Nannocystis punicea]|uniref:Fibronectin type-III domain-containing protein n=1 Tax=Nannocystis punicea TaxID=2995304 RepID=A0ABY7H965_9BACT|nr:hypothetical protein [Nannocystis poenicansa]WAS95635.1 hypothetical protein O0S08_05685 [Nannocystis poenicansa]